MIDIFPRALSDLNLLPVHVRLGEFICADHSVGSNDKNRCIGDGVVGLLGFGLGILECFDILGD